MKDSVFRWVDLVRETGFRIHCFLGPGHLERVYENALVHRLRNIGLHVETQKPITVLDEDGTVLGEYFADLLVEGTLIVEVKAVAGIAGVHVAQILGYLRGAGRQHGLLVNFGAERFEIRKFVMRNNGGRTGDGPPQETRDRE